MFKQTRKRWVGVMGTLIVSMACGCALTHGLGTNRWGPEDTGFAAQGPERSRPPLGNHPPAGVAPGQFAPPPAPLNEQVSFMTQKLAGSEDDRRVLAARLQQSENRLQEKEKAIMLANFEIQEAAKDVAQARADLRQWKQEMETLRSQLRCVESDNKVTLEAIIRTLEQFMDREKAGKSSEPSGPILNK